MFAAAAHFWDGTLYGTEWRGRVDNGALVVITSGDLILALSHPVPSQDLMALTTTSALLEVLVGLALLRSARCGALAHA